MAEVFPDRFKTVEIKGESKKVWNVADFTLAEIRQLDAGSWFDKKFTGTKVLTFQEAIDFVKGKAGIYPETKEPEFYGRLGFDMVKLLMAELKKNGLDKPGAIQRRRSSFSRSARRACARCAGPAAGCRWFSD